MAKNEQVKKVVLWLIGQGFAVNQEEIAEKTGNNISYFSQVVSGSRPVTSKFVNKFCKVFSNVNADYLLTGNGQIEIIKIKENSSCDKFLPLIPIEAMAGYVPGIDYDGVVLGDCEQYLVPEFQKIGAEFMIRVTGDSMAPTYRNGEVLACRMVQEILFFQWGKVYVLDTSQGALVKRVFEHKKPDFIVCLSDNKENFPPFDLPRSDIRGLGLVLGVVRLE